MPRLSFFQWLGQFLHQYLIHEVLALLPFDLCLIYSDVSLLSGSEYLLFLKRENINGWMCLFDS
jgi:hypothetical protein